MPPLTLLAVEPEQRLEFQINAAGCSAIGTRLRLSNISNGLVAYKVKSTASKLYVIKPSTGSVRKGEVAEVLIMRRPSEGEDAENGQGGAAGKDRRPDRFLVQAAVVDSDEKKLLLHAGQRGKAQGTAKFWDSVPKESLEEQQLEAAVMVDESSGETCGGVGGGASTPPPWETASSARGAGAQDGKAARPGAARTEKANATGMPTDQDIDAIIGKMSKPGRSQGAAPPWEQSSRPTASRRDGAGQGSEPLRPEPPWARATSNGGAEVSEAAPALKKSVPRRKEDMVLQKHSRPVTCLAVDPSGKVLYTCGKDKLVFAWTLPDGEFLRQYEGHRGAVWACSVSGDAALLLTCGADSLVLLWDAQSAQQLAEVQLPGVVRCVEWEPIDQNSRRRRFVASSNSFKDKPAAIALLESTPAWEKDGKQGGAAPTRVVTIEEPELPSAPTQVAWAGVAGDCVCSVHPNGEVLFWDPSSGASLGRLQAHEGPASQVAFARDRGLMASCGRTDLQVKLWDLSSGMSTGQALLLQSLTIDRPLNAVALHPSLTRTEAVASSASSWGTKCVCLVGGGQDARDVALVGAGTDDQFDPVPLRFGESGVLEIHGGDASEEQRGRKSGGHFGPIHFLAFTLDAALCLSGSEDGNVRIRELAAAAGAGAGGTPAVPAGGQATQPSAAVLPPSPQQRPQPQPQIASQLQAHAQQQQQQRRQQQQQQQQQQQHHQPTAPPVQAPGQQPSLMHAAQPGSQPAAQPMPTSPVLRREAPPSSPGPDAGLGGGLGGVGLGGLSFGAGLTGNGNAGAHTPAAREARPAVPSGPPPPAPDRSQCRVAAYDFDPASLRGQLGANAAQLLPLRRGQQVDEVLDVGGGWALGHLAEYPTVRGLFPTSYVIPVDTYHAMLQAARVTATPGPLAGKTAEARAGFGHGLGAGSAPGSGLGLGSGLGFQGDPASEWKSDRGLLHSQASEPARAEALSAKDDADDEPDCSQS